MTANSLYNSRLNKYVRINMKKIIGILAGMGPAASVALFDNIVKMTDA